jgi:hypothetical protein
MRVSLAVKVLEQGDDYSTRGNPVFHLWADAFVPFRKRRIGPNRKVGSGDRTFEV